MATTVTSTNQNAASPQREQIRADQLNRNLVDLGLISVHPVITTGVNSVPVDSILRLADNASLGVKGFSLFVNESSTPATNTGNFDLADARANAQLREMFVV